MAIASFFEQAKAFIPKSIQCWKEGYSLRFFRKDLLAGITVGIIAFPAALAVAVGINVDPERAIFTAIIAGFIISALGGTRLGIGGPTSTLIVILYDIVLRHGFEGMLMATFMAGVILICFGLMGLGTYIKYMPYPVVTGLTTGIAVVIFSSQFKEFLGLQMGDVPIDFLLKWKAYVDHLSTWNPTAFAVGMATLLIIIYLRRVKPNIPGPLIALVLVAGAAWLFNLDIPTIGTKYGTLPRTLPFPSLPAFDFSESLNLLPDALAIAILAGIESLLSAVVADGMTGGRHQSNTELVAQGIANIGTCFFGGIPATGSLSRTAVNVKSGAKTPFAGMIHAVVVLLLLLAFAPLVTKIPLACLAAILFMIAWGMSEIHHFVHLFSAPKKDVIVLLAVFILTLLTNITAAVQMGMVLAAFLFMKQMSDLSDVVSTARYFDEEKELTEKELLDPDAISRKEVPEGIEVYEINGPFFFGVADRLKNLLNELERPPKIFILRMRRVPTIDASGMHALEEFYLECRRQGSILLLSGVKRGPLNSLRRYQLDALIGEDHIFAHINGALAFSRELLRSEKIKDLLRN